jgi:hypothetical protein
LSPEFALQIYTPGFILDAPIRAFAVLNKIFRGYNRLTPTYYTRDKGTYIGRGFKIEKQQRGQKESEGKD